MKLLIVLFYFALISVTVFAQLPQVAHGTVVRYNNFKSAYIKPRNVDVWLPDGYTPAHKYAVLYMHDGQMLFDSTQTWNHTEWRVDETISELIATKRIKPCIVVGIWNIPADRFADYYPQKVIPQIEEPSRSVILNKLLVTSPNADNYLQFIVKELKPFIDSAYSTLKGASNTYMMGSSMGGLISAYALCEYPDVFGGVACLSTHLPMVGFDMINDSTDQQVAGKFRQYLSAHLPNANSRKIYFDYGDQTGDKYYKPYQQQVDALMRKKRYDNKHWQTRFFSGADHSETSWARRLDIPLIFLLGN